VLRLSRFVLSPHKPLVVGFSLVVLGAGAVASSRLQHRVSQQVTLPGAAGYEANQQILRLYGKGGDGYPEVVAVRLPAGETTADAVGRRALARGFAAAGRLADVQGGRLREHQRPCVPHKRPPIERAGVRFLRTRRRRAWRPRSLPR
jgi:hypothetical protein